MIRALTPSQRDLLTAACASADPAESAWQRWSAAADLDALEPGAYGLLPLVFRNLEQQAPTGILFRKAAAIYRHTWLANELALRCAARIAATLHERRIEFAVAGDVALTLSAYPDAGARPIIAIDFVMRGDSIVAAASALTAAGLRTVPEAEHLPRAGSMIALADADGRPVRLCATLPPARNDRHTRRLLTRVQSQRGAGTTFPILSAADLLLMTCEHLCESSSDPALPVLADAWRLVGAVAASWGWDRFVAVTRDEQLALTVDAALGALHGAGAHLPEVSVPAALRGTAGRIEKWEYRMKTRAAGRLPGRGLLLDALRHFREGWLRSDTTVADRLGTLRRLPSLILRHLSEYARDRMSRHGRTVAP